MNKKVYLRLGSFLYSKLNQHGYFLRKCHQVAESTTSVLKYPKPTIPLRIERESTDILKALARTVGQDFTSSAYKYHDDPYLHPFSRTEKRSYALAKEAGQKAARWIRETHSEYFDHQPDEPVIECLKPRLKFGEDSQVTENDLINCVRNFQVPEATQVYELCQTQNIELSDDVRQSLLELLSFSNCQEETDPDWLEEISHQSLRSRQIKKTWKDGNLAEEIFHLLKENGNQPYCSIIQGMCKFGEANNAWKLYMEAISKGLPLDTETFNQLIRMTSVLHNEYTVCWEKAEDLLRKMVELGLPPNVGTMNSILECLTQHRTWNWEDRKVLCLKVLSEFKLLDIEPCLASYYYVMWIFGGNTTILENILDDINSRTMTVQDPHDTMFPYTTMDICWKKNMGLQLAEKLNEFLQKGDNIRFLGSPFQTHIYFRAYMSLAVGSMPFPEFMSTVYDRLIPNVYSLDKEVLEEIFRNMAVQNELAILPRIWSTVVRSMLFDRDVFEMVLMLLNSYTWDKTDRDLEAQLGSIARDIWNKFNEINSKEATSVVAWGSELVCDLISSLVKSDQLESAVDLFTNLYSNPALLAGSLSVDTLTLLCDATLRKNLTKEAKLVAKYAKENDYAEGEAMLDKISGDVKPAEDETTDEVKPAA